MSPVMTKPAGERCGHPRLEPEGAFVIQLRSDSDIRHRRLRGRVEHVMSGQSEPFTSLARLLTFMARYAAPGPVPTSTTGKKEDLS
jgi:hypothetical protein